MRLPDLDKIRSEKILTFKGFIASYNENLPEEFPRASSALLREFKKTHEALFTGADSWSLDQHRKKVMDWLTSRKFDKDIDKKEPSAIMDRSTSAGSREVGSSF